MIFQWVLQGIASSKIKLFRLYFPISMLDIIIGSGYCVFADSGVFCGNRRVAETREDVIVGEMLIFGTFVDVGVLLFHVTHKHLNHTINIYDKYFDISLLNCLWNCLHIVQIRLHTGNENSWNDPLLSFYFMRLRLMMIQNLFEILKIVHVYDNKTAAAEQNYLLG